MKFNTEDELRQYIREKHRPDFIRGEWKGAGYYHLKRDSQHSNRHGWESVCCFVNNTDKIQEIKDRIKELIDEFGSCILLEGEKYRIYNWIEETYLFVNAFYEEEWVDDPNYYCISYFDKDTAEKIVSRNNELRAELVITNIK